MKPLGDAFIKLIRMMIAPIIFGTVVVGIAKMGDMKQVGRIGLRALVYFEVVSTVALLIGLVFVNVMKPGAGINANAAQLDPAAVAAYTSSASHLTTTDFLMNIIPTTIVNAFATGDILQVLFFSVLFGVAVLHMGTLGKQLVNLIDHLTHALFGMVAIIMYVSAIGAFGAMAYTIGQFGIKTLVSLGELMLVDDRRVPVLHLRGSRHDRMVVRDQPLEVLEVHQGRNPDRHGDFVIGNRAAADDGEAGTCGLREARGRPGDPDRLLIQPRRHLDLHVDGRHLHRAGDEHAADARPAARHPRGAAPDVEGRGRRDGQRLHHAGGDAVVDSRRCRWPDSRC